MLIQKIKPLFIQYWLVLVCSVFVGAVCSFGQYYSIYKLGNEYHGVPYLYQDNDDVYMSRIRELVEGRDAISSPYFFEYKDASAPLLPYGEMFYALPVKLLNFNLITFVHLSKFLFPAILFGLVFSLIHLLLRKRSMLTALVGATLIILAPDILSLGYVKNIFDTQNPFLLSIWTRLVNPITGALLLFSFFIVLVKIRECSILSIIFSGLLLGFMPGYFFSFALASLTTIFLLLFLVLGKNYRVALRLSLVFPIAFLVSAKYFITQIQGIISGGTLATSLRNGLLITHSPLSNNTLILGLVILLSVGAFLFLKKKDEYLEEKSSIQFLFAGLLAGLVAFNQQIITGKTIWPFHFVQYTKPLVFIAILYCGYLLFSKYTKFWRAIMIFSLIFIFGIGIKGALSYQSNLEQYREYQRYGAVAGWLNSNATKDCVIIAKEADGLRRSSGSIIEKLHLLVPAVTRCDSYISLYTFFNVPQERIYHNYLAYLRINGVTIKTIDKFLKENRRQMINVFFSDWNEMFYNGPNNSWLVSVSDVPAIERKVDNIAQKIATDYPIFMRQDFGLFLKQYRVDYFIYDEKYGGLWNNEWNKFLNKETELGDFVVYSFR
ncbi:MAG: hypothetical protein A2735_00580 [Candidatus Yanofskybacteria bacterium RIFCSPHIGHO2_01_FULL_41_21]|uniref:Glycosyltransferase RgtA/B/C/D-like domain-containing protein n=1 Tax=Candidatus Yanofskybacteria bacterium RIFCSPHIGHO2_01_FULL_41_21 TaxID=1802660 RepID=A0A1F8ECY7_9BACT|nr:MAG: hypothetical protein A2735_00580 [Candidatus Yanofskybacteria bacterium RIFCSPHIGHO2_01_FULL_41_21]